MAHQSIMIGETLNIKCRVLSASPAPNEYMWTKVGNEAFSQTGPVLIIQNIQFRHAGMYRCTAVNVMIPTFDSPQQGSDVMDVIVNIYMLHF